MNKFTTSSKPKVLYYGSHEIKADTIELVSVYNINIELINYLNPDLIVTDSKDIDCLMSAPLCIRRKWVLYNEYTNQYILHTQAVNASLIKNDDLISVFTSVYNTGIKLLETYESLKSQIYENWEWVIVNDGDDSMDEIIKLISDPRVKYYKFSNRSNGNIGEAKYRAAMLCSGSYLVELDHDDILTNDCLIYIMLAFKTNSEVGFVYSDCVEYNVLGNYSMQYGNGFAFGFEHHYEYKGYYPYTVAPLNPLTIRHIVSVPNHVRAWEASMYRKIGGHCRGMRIADDYELIVRSFLHTKFMYIPKMLYIQRYYESNSQNHSDNRSDIQYRVSDIVHYYNDQITKRFNELGIDDICKGMTASEAYTKVDLSKLVNCNEVLKVDN